MKRLVRAGCSAVAVVALAGCGGGDGSDDAKASAETSSPATATQDLTLSFVLKDSARKSSCSTGGGGGFSDISSTTPVVVRDGQQEVLVTVPLGDDCQLLVPGDRTTNNMGGHWTTHIDLPTDKGPYSIEVGDRGASTFTEAELEQEDWIVRVGLGGF